MVLCPTHVPNILKEEDIYKITKNPEPTKAHGHDMIRICMIKLRNISICKPLAKIALCSGKFPSEWKKTNVVPTFKKGDKQCIKNNSCPVFLLPVCSFFRKRLNMTKTVRFRPGDSCTNQLLSIPRKILSAFDDGHKVRGVFLDMSKKFDRVWHETLLFKL